jgi:hypothetical protein
MSCSEYYYSGLGACKSFREKVNGVIITDVGVTITPAYAKELVNWKAILAGVASTTGIYIPFDRGYQNNSSEPEITTSNLGYSEKTFDPPPMIKGFGDMSYCDYKTFFAADNQSFDVFLVLRDGTIEGTKQADGTLKGYRGSVNLRFNAPVADNLQESYPFDIHFKDVTEWKVQSTLVTTNFSITNLKDAVPAGINLEVIVPWDADAVTIKLVKRCNPTAPYIFTAAAVGNFPILYSKSDLAPSIASVDDASKALGIYILTTLGVADDITIQAIDDNGSNRTYVSQPETIIVPEVT